MIHQATPAEISQKYYWLCLPHLLIHALLPPLLLHTHPMHLSRPWYGFPNDLKPMYFSPPKLYNTIKTIRLLLPFGIYIIQDITLSLKNTAKALPETLHPTNNKRNWKYKTRINVRGHHHQITNFFLFYGYYCLKTGFLYWKKITTHS